MRCQIFAFSRELGRDSAYRRYRTRVRRYLPFVW